MPVKDFEDHHGAVHHLAAELLLEVEVCEGEISWSMRTMSTGSSWFSTSSRSSSRLPVPKYAAESNLARFCVNLPTTSNPSVFRELAQLRERGVELDVADAGLLHRRHDGAGPLLVEFLHDGARAYQAS